MTPASTLPSGSPLPVRQMRLAPGPWLMALLALVACTWPAALAAQSRTLEQEARELAATIAEQRHPALALAKAHQLENLRSQMPPEHYAALAEQAAQTSPSPLVRFYLLRQATRARLEGGDVSWGQQGWEGPLASQGCLGQFAMAGPFENPAMQAFASPLGPEMGQMGPYEGKVTQIEWRPMPAINQHCALHVGAASSPSSAAVTYLASRLSWSREQKAHLMVGARGAYRIWLNGKLVAHREEDHGFGMDALAWPIGLSPGSNHLLVKLASAQDSGMMLAMRLTDERFEPLDTREAQGHFEPMQVTSPVALPAPSPDSLLLRLRELALGAQQPGQRIVAASLWSWLQSSDPGTPWRDVAEDVARTPGPTVLTPNEATLLAQLFEEHWRRLEILEKAHIQHPEDPALAVALARELGEGLSQMGNLRRRALLEGALRRHPQYLPALLDLADWLAVHEQPALAKKRLEAARTPEHLRTATYVRRLGELVGELGPEEEARKLKALHASLTQATGSGLWSQLREQAAMGRFGDALAALRQQRATTPWASPWALEEVRLLRAAGQMDEAIGAVDGLIADNPGDAGLHEHRARLQLAQGQLEHAMTSLSLALGRRPQDTALQDFLDFLRPEQDRFYEPWMVTGLRELAHVTPTGSYSHDTLVDQSLTRVASNGLSQQVSQRVIRVITPEGIDEARTQNIVHQGGDERVEVLAVRVHKPDGTVLEDFDQWRQGSSRKASTTYNDSASVVVRANNVAVGDLVEFRYIVSQVANENFRGDYFGDVAFVQSTQPVALSRYAVIYPANWELHFRPPALPHTREERTLKDGQRVSAFEVRNVPAARPQRDQPGFTEVFDHILVSNKRTYDEIGRWWWNLVKHQLVVDDTIRDKARELTAPASDERQKVRAIYNYVARNTRYLHVGLGIHGWKPYRTTTVMRNRYGDCKDKAALLKVMLESAGIPAELVLVRTRRLGSIESQPASMHVFNHAITYVPSLDLFLDATAEYNGSHELTSMDQGAQALIVQDGGTTRWLTLPVDAPANNRMENHLEVDLTGQEPVVRGRIVAHGSNAVYFRQTLEDAERRQEALEGYLAQSFPGARLTRAVFANLDNLDAPTQIDFEFTGGQLLRQSDTRRFVYPAGAPRDLLSAMAREARRTQDLVLDVPFVHETHVRYRIDPRRTFAQLPDPTSLSTRFGAMQVAYEQKDQELRVTIRYSVDVPRIAVADYPEFRSYLAHITNALQATIALGEEAGAQTPTSP